MTTTLSPLEEQVLRMRDEGWQPITCARVLGVTRIEVRRIERAALRKLRGEA